MGFSDDASGKEPACQSTEHETWVWSLGWEDPMEEDMATHSSILAWRIPWTEEIGRLWSTGSQKSWPWLKQLRKHIHMSSCKKKNLIEIGVWDAFLKVVTTELRSGGWVRAGEEKKAGRGRSPDGEKHVQRPSGMFKDLHGSLCSWAWGRIQNMGWDDVAE